MKIRRSAFTLIELLITIVLFSLLVATSLYSFRFISINVRDINNHNPKSAINYALLRGAIGSIYPYFKKDKVIDNHQFFPYFKGDKIGFRFVTNSPLLHKNVSLGELYFKEHKIIYREEEIFKKGMDYGNLNKIKLPRKITIAENISDIKFFYYRNGESRFDIQNEIPNLIKVKFKKFEEEREYIFSVKSNNIGQRNMVEAQYKEF